MGGMEGSVLGTSHGALEVDVKMSSQADALCVAGH